MVDGTDIGKCRWSRHWARYSVQVELQYSRIVSIKFWWKLKSRYTIAHFSNQHCQSHRDLHEGTRFSSFISSSTVPLSDNKILFWFLSKNIWARKTHKKYFISCKIFFGLLIFTLLAINVLYIRQTDQYLGSLYDLDGTK